MTARVVTLSFPAVRRSSIGNCLALAKQLRGALSKT